MDAVCPTTSTPPSQLESSSGAYLTQWKDTGNRDPVTGSETWQSDQTQQVPGSAGVGGGTVNCLASNLSIGTPIGLQSGQGATGSAQLQALLIDQVTAQLGAPPISIAKAEVQTQVIQPKLLGDPITTAVMATAHGIKIQLPGGAALSIGEVTQTAKTWATGQAGGAGTLRTVAVSGVSITAAGTTKVICQGVCPDPQAAADAINRAFPGLVQVSLPQPETAFGTDKTTGLPLGSPGGYQAKIQENPIDLQADEQYNHMPSDEASYLPAIRVVLYDDGSAGLNREVVDLAGAQADSQQGITDFGPSGPPPAPVPTPTSSAPNAAPSNSTVTTCRLGQTASGGYCVTFQPATYIPGRPGTSGAPTRVIHRHLANVVRHPSVVARIIAGAQNVFEQFLKGFGWAKRHWQDALQMFAMMLLLGLPLLLLARRASWLSSTTND